MKCSNCGSENTVVKEGISKKSGKPYKGLKCGDCDLMDFKAFQTQSQKPAYQKPMPQPVASGDSLITEIRSVVAQLKELVRELRLSRDPLEKASAEAGAIFGAKKVGIPNGVDQDGPF